MQHMEDEKYALTVLARGASLIGNLVVLILIFWLAFKLSVLALVGVTILLIVLALANYFEGRAKGQLDKLNENE